MPPPASLVQAATPSLSPAPEFEIQVLCHNLESTQGYEEFFCNYSYIDPKGDSLASNAKEDESQFVQEDS